MSMKSKKIVCNALIILVLVLSSAGLCFATSSENPLEFDLDDGYPEFSVFIENPSMYNYFNIKANVPSSIDTSTYYRLFNNIFVNFNDFLEGYGYKAYFYSSADDGLTFTNLNKNIRMMDSSSIYVNAYGQTNFVVTYSPNNSGQQIPYSVLSPSVSFGLNNVYDFIGSSVIERFHFSLPYGNVLLISSESGFTINRRAYSISNTTYNFQKYVRASDNFSYRVNGSYQGVVENSNVVGTFGVNVFGSNDVMSLLIPWQPVNQNVLGRATSYNYFNASPDPTAEVSVLSGQSFMIWYPYYSNNQDTSKINETNMDVSIDIYHSAPITFTTFPITGSTSSSGEDAYIQNTASVSSGGSSSQSYGGDGSITVTFDNAPSAGGNHGQAPINDNNSILGVLSNLQNTLLGLFNKAIDGIHNLISLGSDFLQSVQIMFSWLPVELLVIITSGFVILLTIGVLKTLWR